MLSLFRKGGASQALIGVVVIVIMVAFIIEFRQGAGTPSGRLKLECAVEVKGRCVEEKEYYAEFMLAVPRGMPLKAVKQLGLRKMVLDGLVERELLLSEAERIGIGIGEEAVNDELVMGRARFSLPMSKFHSVAQYLFGDELVRQLQMSGEPLQMVTRLNVENIKTKVFDMKQYEREIRLRTNRGPKEFKDMQTSELVAERMRDLVRAQVRIAAGEAFAIFDRERSKAVARIVRIDKAWFNRWIITVNDAAVEHWQKENASKLDAEWETSKASWKAGCSLVSEISLGFRPGATDEEKLPAREKMDAIHERLEKGESFADIARKLSDGKTALAGGELGCLPEGEETKALTDAVGKLAPGKPSAVVEDKRGLHILLLQGKLDEKDIETTGRRTLARRLATDSLADVAARDFAAKLIEAAKAGETLEAATQRLIKERLPKPKRALAAAPGAKAEPSSPALDDTSKPRLEITAPFTITAHPIADSALGQSPAAIAFGLEKPDALHPDPIPTRNGAAVLQLKEKTIATREEFAKDQDSYTATILAAKQNDALVAYVARLREAGKSQIKVNERLAEDPKQADEQQD